MERCFNPVVMSGGVGSRLWPLSRASFPKQYQVLVDNSEELTMLQQTFARLSDLSLGINQVICNQEHRFLAAEQIKALNIEADLVLEPVGRNTAPAVVIAALRLISNGNDDPMLVLSADHSIADEVAFKTALLTAHELASSGLLVCLGIKPSFACSGYGYIRYGEALVLPHASGTGYFINQFVEKPSAQLAEEYLASQKYLWNSGMFVMRPSVLLSEAKQHCAALLACCKSALESGVKDLDFFRLAEKEFSACENISLDYAIMEHTLRAAVVPVDCGWSDVGDLNTLWQANSQDMEGNVCQGDTFTQRSNSCFIKSTSRLVAAVGVEGLAIIETKDAVLVAPLQQAQQVKALVEQLAGRKELEFQREVYRPWGSYDSVDSGPNYQVKRISVNAGARLSLQKHKFRAEHWVVVEGTATVHVDGIDTVLHTNDSVFIPKGAVHCLSNETGAPLHLVEVQSGSYLGEDDIERLRDDYARN